ncbi:4-hydroxy-tetrahydrodipicolinate synthase [hydrothermal vent metagenome]|uniref:4-hydroxy-tetrahydrodipicolinate synthase n=1 Tax=hydrothermal vent metagenome TaxID=652676 RepID=A0A3B0SGM2_9ZZZZ
MFSGSIPALVTPFRDGVIDVPALAGFVEWQIASGSHGLVPCGTTGEASTLEPDERQLVIKTCVAQAKGRVPVIAGAGSNATHRAVDLAQMAKQAGADAILVSAPWYNKPNQDGIIAHFAAISKVGIPVIIYNVPGRTVVDISVQSMGQISKLPNMAGVKDATGDLMRVQAHREICGADFVLLSGDDPTALGFYQQGGVGCISVTANVLPETCAAFQNALRENDLPLAQKLDQQMQAAHKAMFADASPAPAKYALAKMGMMRNELRLPMLPAKPSAEKVVDLALAGFLK